MAKSRRNKSYWLKRSLLVEEKLHQKTQEYFMELSRQYDYSMARVRKEIEAFYGRFARENNISYADARRILTTDERRAYQMSLEEYLQKARRLNVDKTFAKEIENASTVYRISRLQSVYNKIAAEVGLLHHQYNVGMTALASETYQDGFYRTVYELDKGFGFGRRFDAIGRDQIERVLAKPWAADKRTFSDRIWGNQQSLIGYLETDFAQGLVIGKSVNEMTRDLMKRFNASRANAYRLVSTEAAFFASASTLEAYKSRGVKLYGFLATLDLKTSEVCQDLDGEIFDVADYVPGVNAPPMHPRCRSTTVPEFEPDEFDELEQRAARDEDGKYYTVPANMKYADWKKARGIGGLLSV